MVEIARNPKQTALLVIDMHRGHLDPELATMPIDTAWAKEILSNTKVFLKGARAIGMKVIYVVMQSRVNHEGLPVDSLTNVNPYSRWRLEQGKLPKTTRSHNLEGSVQTQIMPEIEPLPGEYIVVKRRYSAFYSTDLELLLRCLQINTLAVAGVNTNNCVTATTVDGNNRDYAMIVLSDCVASRNGRHLHEIALELIGTTYGWVMTSKDVLRLMESKTGSLQSKK